MEQLSEAGRDYLEKLDKRSSIDNTLDALMPEQYKIEELAAELKQLIQSSTAKPFSEQLFEIVYETATDLEKSIYITMRKYCHSVVKEQIRRHVDYSLKPKTVFYSFVNPNIKTILPTQGSDHASGMDIRSVEDRILRHGETYAFSTNIAVEIPNGYDIKIHSRSGLAYKNSVFVLNSPGVIDNDYRNEIKVILHNAGFLDFKVETGDRIAQMILYKVEKMELQELETLSTTKRNMAGLGSTGIK